MTVHILPKWFPAHYYGPEVDTTLNSGDYRDLSPFILGPIDTYVPGVQAQNFENLWQFSKVYREYIVHDVIQPAWFQWRDNGWADKRAHRYPKGKGRKPEFSYWDGERLGYIEARKQIYARIYAEYVVKTNSYQLVQKMYQTAGIITLKDYDAYDHISMGLSLKDVINNPDRKMGHAFVLAMMLQGELEECLK